jgi:hypothetical protein
MNLWSHVTYYKNNLNASALKNITVYFLSDVDAPVDNLIGVQQIIKIFLQFVLNVTGISNEMIKQYVHNDNATRYLEMLETFQYKGQSSLGGCVPHTTERNT